MLVGTSAVKYEQRDVEQRSIAAVVRRAPEWALRAAHAEDADVIAKVMRRSRTASLPFLPRLHSADEDLWFVRHRVLPAMTVVVAVDTADQVGGFIAYDEAWVHHLYLVPEAQRLGLGSRLLTQALAEHATIRLWCFQANGAARRFYAKHGFVEERFTDGSANEEKTPDVLLVRRRPVSP